MLAYCKKFNRDIKNNDSTAIKTFHILTKHLPRTSDTEIFKTGGTIEVFRIFQKEFKNRDVNNQISLSTQQLNLIKNVEKSEKSIEIVNLKEILKVNSLSKLIEELVDNEIKITEIVNIISCPNAITSELEVRVNHQIYLALIDTIKFPSHVEKPYTVGDYLKYLCRKIKERYTRGEPDQNKTEKLIEIMPSVIQQKEYFKETLKNAELVDILNVLLEKNLSPDLFLKSLFSEETLL